MTPARSKPTGVQAQGWKGRLNLEFETAGNRTVVRRTHSGPISMQRTLYPESDVAHVYMLHPPGGVVGGDSLQVNVSCQSGAAGLMTTPGANKFYRSAGDTAHVSQMLNILGGSIEWFPQENIFFNDSRAALFTKINVQKQASVAWWEVNCFGRGAGADRFERGSIETVFELCREQKLLLRERLHIDGKSSIQSAPGLRGNTVTATLVLTPIEKESVEIARNLLSGLTEFVASWFDNLLIIRFLGQSSEVAKQGLSSVWSELRMALNGRKPVYPRIWHT